MITLLGPMTSFCFSSFCRALQRAIGSVLPPFLRRTSLQHAVFEGRNVREYVSPKEKGATGATIPMHHCLGPACLTVVSSTSVLYREMITMASTACA